MADIEHSAIADGQRHEPKGIDNTTAGELYVSDGGGSGTTGSWKKLPSSSIDTTGATAGQYFLADGSGGGSWKSAGGDVYGQMEIINSSTNKALTASGDLTDSTTYVLVDVGWQAPTLTTNSGVVYAANTLTVPTTGTYRIEFWGSFITPNSSVTGFKFGVNQPAIPLTAGALSNNTMKRTSSASADYGVAAAHQMVDLTASDTISLYAASTVTGNLLIEDAVMMIQLVST